jgi:hypothetical protein
MLGNRTLAVVFVCFAATVVVRPAAAEVRVTMSGGRVSLLAKNATVGQILAEWAKVGQTKIVNAERAGGGPMTLELTDVPEVEALEIILRSAAGYVLAPRQAETANASRFDRILILPPSAPVRAPQVVAAPAARPQPRVFAQPQPFAPQQPGQLAVQPPATDGTDDPAERPTVGNPGAQPARPPVFNTFPQAAPQQADPPAPATPSPSVTVPVGVSVPGMVVPTPQPAGQPGVVTPPQQQR